MEDTERKMAHSHITDFTFNIQSVNGFGFVMLHLTFAY